jgi:hypothetical protein
MPKIGCICGFVHNLSPIPDDGWVAVRDRDYEKLVAAWVALSKEEGSVAEAPQQHYTTIADTTVRLYECPECGVLAWLTQRDQPVRFFGPLPST